MNKEKKQMMDANQIRIEALDRSVRVALAEGGNESADEIVTRAKTFESFLTAN